MDIDFDSEGKIWMQWGFIHNWVYSVYRAAGVYSVNVRSIGYLNTVIDWI